MRQIFTVALAYVGVLVGAGLSSGQDLLQYFLSFGRKGILGVLLLGALNVFFGRVIITLGCYYQSKSHQDVLKEISHPVSNRIIDLTLVLASFVMGFVMVAGAGANLKQQFGLPFWAGTLLCSLLIFLVSFLDFEKITAVLGIFTPLIIGIICFTSFYIIFFTPHNYEAIEASAHTIRPAIPNLFLSVINYFTLCAMTGVSMAFVLGGSLVRITVAERGGLLGGALVGLIIVMAALTLYFRLDSVVNAEIPMLTIMHDFSPVLSFFYAFIIFALIFNTAFSLYYATARRFAGTDPKKMRIFMAGITLAGFLCSFGGFKTLVGILYPVLGYMGIFMLLILFVAWIRERDNIILEKFIRRKMLRIALKKHDSDADLTKKDRMLFRKLSETSAADTSTIKQRVLKIADDIAARHDDLHDYAAAHLPIDPDALRSLSLDDQKR